MRVAVDGANFKTILVFASDLACTATSAPAHIKVKSNGHGIPLAPLGVHDALRPLAVRLKRVTGVLLNVANLVVVARNAKTAVLRTNQVVVGTGAVDAGFLVDVDPSAMGHAHNTRQQNVENRGAGPFRQAC